MRKPRDFDTELKALADKARTLKERRVQQFGALVAATGADALDVEILAGALLGATRCDDMIVREEWRRQGAAFFQGAQRRAARSTRRERQGAEPSQRGQAQVGDEAGAP